MSLTSLVHRDQVINVRTGELLDLVAASPEQLAQAREGLTALGHEVDDAKSRLDAEIVARVDAAMRSGEISQYTNIRLGDYAVTVRSPEGKVNDRTLRHELLERAGDYGLSRNAVAGAFKTTVSYKLNRRIYSALAKQAPALNEVLRRHTEPGRRRATVTAITGSTPPVAVAADVIEGQESFSV